MVSPFLSPAFFSFTVLAQTETCVASIEAVFSAFAHCLKASADFQVSWLRPILAVNLIGLVARVSNNQVHYSSPSVNVIWIYLRISRSRHWQ